MRLLKVTTTALAFATVVLSGKCAHAQANVKESTVNYIYVDAANGNNSNSGDQSAPLRTVQAALNKADALNHKGQGSRVEILPGTYREFPTLGPSTGRTSAPITIEAVTPGTATLDGSDVYTNWTDEGNETIYDHPWSYKFGQCRLPSGWPTGIQPIVFRRELVSVNGVLMNQVLSTADLLPGTFLVDESAGRLRLAPPAGVDMSTAKIEVGTRPRSLLISGRTNVVLRGLQLEHAASCLLDTSAFVWNSHEVLIDHVTANNNAWNGLGIANGTNITIQNSTGSYNGGLGISISHMKYVLLTNSEADYNNWRGVQGAFYDWGMGGIKFWQTHDATVSNVYTLNNHAQGLWFDTDNRDITVSHSVMSGNLLANLQVELNAGPISMDDSVLCYGGIGVNLNSSANFTLTNSKLFNNGGGPTVLGNIQGEFYVAGPNDGRHFTDFETHEYHNVTPADVTMTGNIIENWSYNNQNALGTYVSGSAWSHYLKTLISDNNEWYDPNRTDSILLSGGKRQTFANWQSSTGLDQHSVWSEPKYSPVQQRPCTAPRNVANVATAAPNADFGVYTDKSKYTASNGMVSIKVVGKSFQGGNISMILQGLPQGASYSLSAAQSFPTKVSTNSMQTLTITPGAKASKGVAIPVTLVASQNGRVHTVTFSVTP